jgi:hypothetical protein
MLVDPGTVRRVLPDKVAFAPRLACGLRAVMVTTEFDVFTDIVVPVAVTATGFDKFNPVVVPTDVMVSLT